MEDCERRCVGAEAKGDRTDRGAEQKVRHFGERKHRNLQGAGGRYCLFFSYSFRRGKTRSILSLLQLFVSAGEDDDDDGVTKHGARRTVRECKSKHRMTYTTTIRQKLLPID